MWVARASRPPTTHIATPTQNSHQIGPRIRPNPPTRNAAIMVLTATQDTGRPWCDTVAGPPAAAGLSWPPSAACPATMPEPTWSAMRAAPLAVRGGDPPRRVTSGPECPWPSPYCGEASLVVCARPRRLGITGRTAYHDWETHTPGTITSRCPLPGWRAKARRAAIRTPPTDPRGARQEVPVIIDRVLHAGEGKILRQLRRIADQVNSIEDDFAPLSDAELRAMTGQFRERLANGEGLDDLLPEAFAAVREAAKRTLGQRHFDVQIMGGAALHGGNIAEMRTGEGKTLVATLPAYLNALTGKGVHVVTVNDYLAKRDSEWMGRVHRLLGLEVGVILAQMTPEERRKAYGADITYGTNNEFGFDYLRDNMAWSLEDCVQRGHNYAIVDEVDSILIDEARTPLIISGPAEQSARWYTEFARLAPMLRRDADYDVEEGKRTVAITEQGVEKVEDQLGIENLYEAVNTPLVGYLNNALKAKELYKRDRDYIVANGEVLIVDEFTGRVLHGRRYNEGMHQAIEAKEAVPIQDENQTLATITLQNYFRLYDKLAGMTGTAQTEAAELHQIYKLGVVPIPTNQPMIRDDQPDVVYKTETAKFASVVDDIAERVEAGQPVLVGTASVEKSELLSAMLLRRGVPHEVLNAKYHEKEAMIVALAGRSGAVTVATNMAGRGTDIVLGGNPEFIADLQLRDRGLTPDETPEEYEAAWQDALDKAKGEVAKEHEEVVDLGGLYVLGTERHESRRIDNQLRGRSGRQGDPGESRFYLSLGG